MTVPPAIAPFVPDLEAGLASAPPGLGRFWRFEKTARPPNQVRAFAVVVVRGHVQLREERTEHVEIPEAKATLGARPAPPEDFLARSEYAFVRSMEPNGDVCSACAHSDGRQLCALCGGSGSETSESGHAVGRCRGCGGMGSLRCSVCEGSTRVRWADVVFGSYEGLATDRFFLPDSLGGPRWALQSKLETLSLPTALQLPLDPRVGSGPYRDAPRPETDFHGFEYERALVDARRHVTGLFSRSHRAQLSLLVVPLLEVTWSSFARRTQAFLLGLTGQPEWLTDSR